MEKGDKFNNWEFIEFIKVNYFRNKISLFKCKCWTIAERCELDIKYWSSKSCGCLTKENKVHKYCPDCWIEIAKKSITCTRCFWIRKRVPDEKRKASLNIFIRNTDEYKEWRTNCFKRDNYICQISWIVWGDLIVHHIKWLSEVFKENNIDIYNWRNIEVLFDIDNWITINKELHKKFHKKYWKTWFTLDNLLEFKANYKLLTIS
jgi:hypothetical protein